jgi:hypothetical protein
MSQEPVEFADPPCVRGRRPLSQGEPSARSRQPLNNGSAEPSADDFGRRDRRKTFAESRHNGK